MTNRRKIAIIADAHALLEPTEAVLEDINRRGITEIYSLGDNIGVGPNPSEVIELLKNNNVITIAGNSEDYVKFGMEPFPYMFHRASKYKSQLWTLSKLNERQIGEIMLYPRSIELVINNRRIALCHFANDVRFDFVDNSTWSYQSEYTRDPDEAARQFLVTNSEEQRQELHDSFMQGELSESASSGKLDAYLHPIFGGKKATFFDAVIQGHVHWKMYSKLPETDFYSIRALGMAYQNDPIDRASYVILTEADNGYEIEEVLVSFDREKMIYSVITSDNPNEDIYLFTEINKKR